MDLGLTGKVAMVGGASRGLGFAVAKALVAEGAQVSIASRDAARIDAAAEALRAATPGAQVLAVPGDLRTAADITTWHDATMERFGGVDLLFVNTGGPPPGPSLSFDDAAWQGAVDLLLLSAVRMVRLAVPVMAARGGGSILMTTSSAVLEPIPNLALSNVVRASVAALVKTLSNELAPQKIRVNNLVPGRIDTDRVRELDEGRAKASNIDLPEQRRRMEASIPLGRYGAPDEFGKAAAFLLSDASAYTTGAFLQIDGGMIKGVW
ncbi:SDR family oxidoreductase [Luteitalea sp.]|jgi:3-oxoacyl-[acyl-carrier protein] reductase|uniref:SDR family oxidoreductase n=1 Tax=Luteitalea sp. TaxID=2004800 RepID=UPI0037C838EF